MNIQKVQNENNCQDLVTEEQIGEVENIWSERAQVWRHYEEEYKNIINQYLKEGAQEELLAFLQNPDFVDKFNKHTEMAYMMFAATVYKSEKNENESHNIFKGRNSIEEVTSCICHIKFLLWHLEFHTENQAEEELMIFIDENRVSMTLLKYMIFVAGFNKSYLLKRLAESYIKLDKFDESVKLLEYSNKLYPEEAVLNLISAIREHAGKRKE